LAATCTDPLNRLWQGQRVQVYAALEAMRSDLRRPMQLFRANGFHAGLLQQQVSNGVPNGLRPSADAGENCGV
jgi:hypothetical protein